MPAPSTALVPIKTPFVFPGGALTPEAWSLLTQLVQGFIDVVTVTGTANTGDVAIFANSEQITGGLVQTANLAAAAVTFAKMQSLSASVLLGRGDSGSGDPQEITLGSNLTMTGTTLSATGGGGGTVTIAQVAARALHGM